MKQETTETVDNVWQHYLHRNNITHVNFWQCYSQQFQMWTRKTVMVTQRCLYVFQIQATQEKNKKIIYFKLEIDQEKHVTPHMNVSSN